ncbi:AraC-like DNA-binding protein [Enterococcus sp. PF1-24]|uniref:helix-turn-helix transcriptional regulator n=1 Tax=unclassified Enterococcus TaxID=2608891 RepID=UPI002475A4AE|nr:MULTISPECIES: AraC family transcriptional regulator [unclassified Enterococcus]MDH6365854.1 AraC-like DNA-binding protein [Enterococcus sp. PFB1-1]MDH6402946.1 AraC-like DNA-binding protein [Enterococcus sp. PF1-24]
MTYTNVQTFNPDILYAFDPWNEAGHSSKYHAHEFMEISIILEGETDYRLEDEELRLGAGRIMLFNPGVYHSEQQPAHTYSHQLHIGINNISLDGLPRNHFPNKKALLDLGEYHSQFLDKAWHLAKEFNEQNEEFQLMGKALLIEMLVLILRSFSQRSNDLVDQTLSKSEKRKQNLVNQTIYYLENRYDQEITLEQLAEIFYVSPTHLSKVFKEVTGSSPINYLIQIRLKHAKTLLKNESASIKEVAQTVGYEDAYHFSKLFKKYYGVAPSKV